jgi:hypothetical protein
MNLGVVMLLSFIFPIYSLMSLPTLCINCKHFLKDNMNGKYAKCFLFPNKNGKINFLVTGIINEEYHYCSTIRDINGACGEDGKFYKKNIIDVTVTEDS